MTPSSVICFYHKNCVDGTAAAALVLKKYDQAQTFPLGFDSASADLAEALPFITKDSLIIYVDNVILIEDLVKLGNQIIVIDHHVSERSRVESLATIHKNLTYIFDQEESAASLCYKYFFADSKLPAIISYIRDIDLWKNELLPESEWTSIYLSLFRNKPIQIRDLLNEESSTYLESGKLLSLYVEEEVSKSVINDPIYLNINNWRIPAYNITNHQSKAGNILSGLTNSTVILFTLSGDRVRLGIRSKTGHFPNALDVASYLQGGGHENSAGAGIDRNLFLSMIE